MVESTTHEHDGGLSSATEDLRGSADDRTEWRYRREPVEVTQIESIEAVAQYKGDDDEAEYRCGEARFRFYKPKDDAKQAGSHEYELTRRSCMSRVEGLTFDPKSERELDKIIDDVALRIDAERPSVGLLVEALSGIASPVWREHIRKVRRGNPDDLEGLVDRLVARNKSFDRRREVWAVSGELGRLQWPNDPYTLYEELDGLLQSIRRMCRRAGWHCYWTDDYVLSMMQSKIPLNENRVADDFTDLEDLLQWMIKKSKTSQRLRMKGSERAYPAVAVGEKVTSEVRRKSGWDRSFEHQGDESVECYRCHKKGHRANVCPMKDLECSNCHKRGHEEKNCRVRVFDSKYGSVGVEMYERGNQLVISTPTLNSRKALYDACLEAATKINQLEEKKRTVEKERRDKKKTSARPDALMEDGEVAKFADTLGAARVTKGVMLNEVVVEALLDTGATTSIVSMDLARQLGLEEAGAGAIGGLFTRKQVTLFKASLATKDRRMETVLYSSEELKDDELILGVPDMIALGIFDACKCQFHVESCYKVNAVSLVEEEKSDQDLLAVAKQLITDMTSHVEDVVRERLWGLLQKHSNYWLRPRTGRTRRSVEFEVDGKPVKHTLKPLRPELREELDKQIDDMLSMARLKSWLLECTPGGRKPTVYCVCVA